MFWAACNICLKSKADLFNLCDRIKSRNLCLLLQTLVGHHHKIDGKNFWICLFCHSILEKIFAFQQKLCESQEHIAALLYNRRAFENLPHSSDNSNLPNTSNEQAFSKNIKIESPEDNGELNIIHIITDANTNSVCDSTVLNNAEKDFPANNNDHQESDDNTNCAPENDTECGVESSTEYKIETSLEAANQTMTASSVANYITVPNKTQIQEALQSLPMKTVFSVIAKIEERYLNNLKCCICEFISESISILKSHMENKHSDESIKWCEICNKIDENELLHTCQGTFVCTFCKLYCSDPNHLITHLYRHVDKSKAISSYPGGSESVPLQSYIKRNRFICRRCKISYPDEDLIRNHKCPQLSKPSSRERYGADGTRRQPKQNVCKYCNKVINHSMKQHIRTHTGEKPYICEYCGKAFSQMGTRTEHLRIHTGRIQCHTCPRAFTSRAHLRNHISRVHKGEKPEKKLLCTNCGYSCTFEFQLKQHLLSHTDERKYGCNLCKMSFKFRTGLHRHMVVHTGFKPYACTLCPYRSNQKGNLKTHMKKHANESIRQAAKNGEDVIQCEHCDRSFHTENVLFAHIKSSHRKLLLHNLIN